MFKRVTLEGWHEIVPYLCFALIAGAFLVIVIRAVRMKRSDIDRIANLPLQDDDEILRNADRKNEKSSRNQNTAHAFRDHE